MEIKDIIKVVKTWQSEFSELSQLPFINYVQIFENRGELMGCSNPHPHGQLWAQKTIPNEVLKKTEQFEKHHKSKGSSLLEGYLEQEIKDKDRIVFENEHFVVLVPFWAVWPFETMIAPKKEANTIMSLKDVSSLNSFAEAIKTITSIYDKVFDISFPYSAGIHQMPTDGKTHAGWHWHMNFYPPLLRSATIKKFMVGYEMFAMPQRDLTAEYAAERLRSLK
jgi:UDPglucose--hexose-1-phosphate uridylyltransferase